MILLHEKSCKYMNICRKSVSLCLTDVCVQHIIPQPCLFDTHSLTFLKPTCTLVRLHSHHYNLPWILDFHAHTVGCDLIIQATGRSLGCDSTQSSSLDEYIPVKAKTSFRLFNSTPFTMAWNSFTSL